MPFSLSLPAFPESQHSAVSLPVDQQLLLLEQDRLLVGSGPSTEQQMIFAQAIQP
jgi:hypothetical protein